MGNGLERAYSKNDFIYYWLQNQRNKIIKNFLVLIQAETKTLQLWKVFWVFSEKGDPWGDLSAPEAASDNSFLSFPSDLQKDSEHIRKTNAQKHFKSTFGSAYLIYKKNEVKTI